MGAASRLNPATPAHVACPGAPSHHAPAGSQPGGTGCAGNAPSAVLLCKQRDHNSQVPTPSKGAGRRWKENTDLGSSARIRGVET